MSSVKVFISYSRDDRPFIEKLVDSLKAEGIDVWFDYHLLSGEDWDDALEDQIKACDHMIIVLSETSAASDNVKNEMRFALDHGKHIHPILYEPCSVPLSMRRMHYIDFVKMGYDTGVSRLVTDIKKRAGMKVEIKKKPTRGKKKKTIIAVIGVIVLVAAAILSWQFWPDSNGIDKNPPVVTTVNWDKVEGSTDVTMYKDYITDHKNSENRLSEAVNAIQGLLKEEGTLILTHEDYSSSFDKLAFRNASGEYVINDSENPDQEEPGEGDLLVIKKEVNVMDPATMDVMSGVTMNPGDLIQFSEEKDLNGQYQVKFYFSETFLPKAVIDSSNIIVEVDPPIDSPGTPIDSTAGDPPGPAVTTPIKAEVKPDPVKPEPRSYLVKTTFLYVKKGFNDWHDNVRHYGGELRLGVYDNNGKEIQSRVFMDLNGEAWLDLGQWKGRYITKKEGERNNFDSVIDITMEPDQFSNAFVTISGNMTETWHWGTQWGKKSMGIKKASDRNEMVELNDIENGEIQRSHVTFRHEEGDEVLVYFEVKRYN
ncbi:MAG: toll/interleukin-1 receptor domain-containing protein [Flavobacteriaceae bacterium]|nr:toll/interleukin-1 receptor domain-containing protein [Flavobacteriaceae bacterium]